MSCVCAALKREPGRYTRCMHIVLQIESYYELLQYLVPVHYRGMYYHYNLTLKILSLLLYFLYWKCCALVRLDVFWPLVAVWE